jgi:ribonuclease Z
MRPSFIPRLVNGPFGDPGLFVPLTFRKRALLFDLGDLSALSAGDILKTTHVFVTHTHMDHFIGFDQLLRLQLGRGKSLHLFGPAGFLNNVMGKLRAYTWNLVQNYEDGLNITATEIATTQVTTQTFKCREGFSPSTPSTQAHYRPVAFAEPEFSVQTAILDHQIPSLAFAVKERFHINILKPRLEQLGLTVGPWVNRFKKLMFEDVDPNTPIQAQPIRADDKPATFAIGELSNRIARITPGQKIAYIADALYSRANEKKITELAREADHLYIEAAFLEKDRQIAKKKHHLTAYQAGTLARKAKVRALSIFHHSPRYMDQAHVLREEASSAFGNRQPRT